MRWGVRAAWTLGAVCLLAAPPLAAAPSSSLAPLLTDAERAWLDAHPTARVAFDATFPPYSLRDASGAYGGFSVELFQLLSERTGVDFVPSGNGEWASLYAAAKEQELDVVATMVHSPDRDEWFAFSEPYIAKPLVVMARANDDRIQHRRDLAGKTVALVRDYQYSARVVAEFPDVQPLYVDNLIDALLAVSTQRADAAITFLAGGHYYRSRLMLTNLDFVALYDRDGSSESIAVRKDWPELAAILTKALGTLTDGERLSLEQRWLPVDSEFHPSATLALTAAEQQWLADHPDIRLGVDPEFHPFEFLDEGGAHRGIAADYVALLNQRTGLNMRVEPGLTWTEVVDRARRREIDVLPVVGRTEERSGFLEFSREYVAFHRVIVTRTDTPFLTGVADLQELRVAVQESSSHAGFLADRTDIEPQTYPTLQAAILAVADGEADALVGNLASAGYWIRELNLTNLKVASSASEETFGLHFAVRNDWPELTSILNKGLASISDEEQRAIAQRWVVLKFDPQTDYGPLVRVALLAAGVLLLALLWVRQNRKQQARLQVARDQEGASRRQAVDAMRRLQELHDTLEELVQERTRELQLSEQRFRQAQKMEALGTLVGGIAHDFNNVLSGILGSLHLARLGADDPEAVREHVDRADRLGSRCVDMIRQLLAFARQEGVEKAAVHLNVAVAEARTLLRPAVPTNIKFLVDTGEVDLWLHGNAALLQQVLFNLVINARDALEGHEAPRIELSLRPYTATPETRLRHPELPGGELLAIELKDNGVGIPAATIDKLFDPFYSTKAPGKGTGLGLAMVYGSVRDHDGVIEVESEQGVGSCFRLLLPRRPAPRTVKPIDSTVVQRGAGEWVLIADDDVDLLQLHGRILSDLGYQVTIAEDGQEAVDRLAEAPERYALALLDGIMPRLTGIAAAKEIRRIRPELPIVFLTGYDSRQEAVEQPDPSKETVLRKPCRVPQLSRAVRKALTEAASPGPPPSGSTESGSPESGE